MVLIRNEKAVKLSHLNIFSMNNNNICAQKTIKIYASNHLTHLNVIDEIPQRYVLSTRITNSESKEQLTSKCDADRKKK